MVQVVSAEIFDLSDRHTGHVTYKTTLTKKGIWALTVGIVDPGWDGPIATTLLNFSKIDHAIADGDAFLRVSFYEHEPVPRIRKAPSLAEYLKDIRKAAASMFPPTFLNREDIADDAGRKVLNRIRVEALVWVAGVALLFTLIQFVVGLFPKSDPPHVEVGKEEMRSLQTNLEAIRKRPCRRPEIKRQIDLLAIPALRTRFIASACQSASNFDPVSASNFDPFARRGLKVALDSSELAGIAETRRARVA
jgi:hypothetical protein